MTALVLAAVLTRAPDPCYVRERGWFFVESARESRCRVERARRRR